MGGEQIAAAIAGFILSIVSVLVAAATAEARMRR